MSGKKCKSKKFKNEVYNMVDPLFFDLKDNIQEYLDTVLLPEHGEEIVNEIKNNLKTHCMYVPFYNVESPEVWISIDYQSSYDLLSRGENISKTLELFFSFYGSFEMCYDLMPPVYDTKIDLEDCKKVELLYTVNQLFQYVESCDFEPIKSVVQSLSKELCEN